jgi:deoxyribonuclease V
MRLPPGTSLAELREEQRRLAAAVSRRNGFRTVRTVAGVDIAYAGDRGFAAIVVLRATDLAVTETAVAARAVDFPYIPGYLAYREFPLIEAAYARLREPPSVLLVDGHGQIHPARCGVACMVGIRLGVPTIGVAKSPLVGRTERTPRMGEAVPVRERGEVLGFAFRPGPSIRLLYISTGHRVAPRTAVRIVRDLCRTRDPEPLRLADSLAREHKENKGKMSKGGSLLAPIPGGERPKARRSRA